MRSVVASPDSASDAAGKGRCEALRKRIAGGEKFAKVAAEVSDDETSARAGGDLGYLVRGTMDPSFEAAVFSPPLNSIGDPNCRPAYQHVPSGKEHKWNAGCLVKREPIWDGNNADLRNSDE